MSRLGELVKVLRLSPVQCSRICTRCLFGIKQQKNWFTTSSKLSGTFEPDGLDEPKIAKYENLDIQLSGYDFAVLELFCRQIHKLGQTLGIQNEIIKIPTRYFTARTFIENSTNVKETYKLVKYERKVRIKSLPSTELPLFLEIVRKRLPEGVEGQMMEISDEVEEFRFIPDEEKLKLLDRISRLDKLKDEREKRKD